MAVSVLQPSTFSCTMKAAPLIEAVYCLRSVTFGSGKKGREFDVMVQFSNEGIMFGAMDAAHIAMIRHSIPKSAFNKLELNHTSIFHINYAKLRSIVQTLARDDMLTLSLANRKGDDYKLVIYTTTPLREIQTMTRQTKIEIRPAALQMNIPALKYTHEFAIPVKTLRNVLNVFRAAEIDGVAVTCGIDYIMFSEHVPFDKTPSPTSTEVVLNHWTVGTAQAQSSKASFSRDYLEKVCEAAGTEPIMLINVGPAIPLMMTTTHGVRYWIAPRVDDKAQLKAEEKKGEETK